MQFTDPSKLSDEELAEIIGRTNFAAVEAIIAESGDAAPNGNSTLAQAIADATPADGDQQAAVS